MNKKLIDIWQKYIKNDVTKKNKNYYSKEFLWRDFFYLNIEHIPYITYIGLFWSIEYNSHWDSNDGAKTYIKRFFDFINHETRIGKSNGFPVYQLFNYLKFNTPSKIKKYNLFIADEVEKNYYDFFMLILNHVNNIIIEHKLILKQIHNYQKEKFINAWEQIYLKIQENKNEVEKRLIFINSMFKLCLFG